MMSEIHVAMVVDKTVTFKGSDETAKYFPLFKFRFETYPSHLEKFGGISDIIEMTRKLVIACAKDVRDRDCHLEVQNVQPYSRLLFHSLCKLFFPQCTYIPLESSVLKGEGHLTAQVKLCNEIENSDLYDQCSKVGLCQQGEHGYSNCLTIVSERPYDLHKPGKMHVYGYIDAVLFHPLHHVSLMTWEDKNVNIDLKNQNTAVFKKHVEQTVSEMAAEIDLLRNKIQLSHYFGILHTGLQYVFIMWQKPSGLQPDCYVLSQTIELFDKDGEVDEESVDLIVCMILLCMKNCFCILESLAKYDPYEHVYGQLNTFHEDPDEKYKDDEDYEEDEDEIRGGKSVAPRKFPCSSADTNAKSSCVKEYEGGTGKAKEKFGDILTEECMHIHKQLMNRMPLSSY